MSKIEFPNGILVETEDEVRSRFCAPYIDALTPSEETKATYMGEFQFTFPDIDSDGNECVRNINVPWTTIKKIMAAIKARAEGK